MMRVPGRKESGVIFTIVTELPPKERLERSERERPSVSGLQCSRDETEGPGREKGQAEVQEKDVKTEQGDEMGEAQKEDKKGTETTATP